MDYLLAISMILFFADEVSSATTKFLPTVQIFERTTFNNTVESYLESLPPPPFFEWCGDWRDVGTNTYGRLIRRKGSSNLAASAQIRVKFENVHIIEQ